MAKEIGGYLELEHFTGQEYYPDLHKANLGRTALIWLLRSAGCKKVYIPYYICNTVTDAVVNAGIYVVKYHLDDALQPVFEQGNHPEQDDWIYIVNYYGQLTKEEICEYRRLFGHIIVDNAQAFFEKPLEGVHTIYTCRKFFGVSDGAYLATDLTLDENLEEDHSFGYMQHLIGRLEEGASIWYQRMLQTAELFEHTPVRKMSATTENLLRAVDYDYVRTKRRENYCILQQLLPSDNVFTRRMPEVPFAYPFYHPDGIKLRKALAEKNIYVPTNWSILLKECPEDSLEYQWSSNILPLPIDQRYNESDMRIIAETIAGMISLSRQ